MRNHIGNFFWGTVLDRAKFIQGLNQAIQGLQPIGIFSGDNMLAFGRNLGFLEDAAFTAALAKNISGEPETSIIWRTHVLCWAAKLGLRRGGDFVECGTYRGTSARILCDYLDWETTGRTFYLYDLFEHQAGMAHHALPDHGPQLYDRVVARFADLPHVRIVRGFVPDSFAQASPDKIAFLHLDMNNAPAETAALGALFDRVADGAPIILDDYGWYGYRAQKDAADAFFAARGITVAELPTGQGLVIK